MIRIIPSDAQLSSEDILGKYIWSRNAVHWTANEIPVFVDRIVKSRACVLREEPVWSEAARMRVLTGGGRRSAGRDISYLTRDYHRGNNLICCTCDTVEEVNAVRALGKTVRADYYAFREACRLRFEALAVPVPGHAPTIRFPAPDSIVTPADVMGKYIWSRPATHWTANEQPSLVTQADDRRAVTCRETPRWDENSEMNIICGRGPYKRGPEIFIGRGHKAANGVSCICTTHEEANRIRALGKTIRIEHHAFWEACNIRFSALAEPIADFDAGPRL